MLQFCAFSMQRVNMWVFALISVSQFVTGLDNVCLYTDAVYVNCYSVKDLIHCTTQLLLWLRSVMRQFDCVWRMMDPHLKNRSPLSQFFEMLSKTILITMHLVSSFFIKEISYFSRVWNICVCDIMWPSWDICIGIKWSCKYQSV